MASRSINRVILLGNLTRDPELKYTPSGTAVCTFGLATNRTWTTADGQTKEDTQYHRIIAWQKLAELCAKLLSKGKKVYLEGRITYREYTDKNGQQRQVTEIVLDDFIVFSPNQKLGTADSSTPQNTAAATAPEEANASGAESAETKDKSEEKKEEEKVEPEDIPF